MASLPSLVVIDGPDRGLVASLQTGSTAVGRDASCGISLSDLQTSRRHAEFVSQDGVCSVVDCGSSNGTRVNGLQVKRQVLIDGDLIVVGNTTLRFRLNTPEVRTPSPLSETQTIEMNAAAAGASLRGSGMTPAEARRAKADLEVLYRVSRDVNPLLQSSQILERLIDVLFDEISRIDRCSIHLVDEDSGQLTCRAQRIRRPSALPGEPYSRTLLEKVLKEGNALLTLDAMNDERFRAGESIRISNMCSAICAPMQARKGVLGIIHIDTVTPENPLDRDDLRLLAAVGVLAGSAVESALLYEKVAYDKAQMHVKNQQLRLAHNQLIHSEKLAATGRLASGIVHDVKNPLTVIMGYAGLIRSKLRKQRPDLAESLGIADDLAHIEKGIDYCTEVINGLLRFVKPGDPAKQPVAINQLIETTLAFVHVETRKAGVRIETRFDENLPPVSIDESQIKQVVINLLLNAVQAMDKPERSIVILSELIPREGQSWVRVTFRDNGRGMTDEQRRHIFEPFYSTKEQGTGPGGTGLGLAVSFTIMESHNGLIEVDSEPGAGSTFSIMLPSG